MKARMGINRRSIFLHALVSSSGVRVGDPSASDKPDSRFERRSSSIVGYSSFAVDIGGGQRREMGGEKEERGVLEEAESVGTPLRTSLPID